MDCVRKYRAWQRETSKSGKQNGQAGAAAKMAVALIGVLPLSLFAACQAAPVPPPVAVTCSRGLNAQPVCQGMRAAAYWRDNTNYAVKQCCPAGDGATWQCWDIP